jgi:hypothetical protein
MFGFCVLWLINPFSSRRTLLYHLRICVYSINYAYSVKKGLAIFPLTFFYSVQQSSHGAQYCILGSNLARNIFDTRRKLVQDNYFYYFCWSDVCCFDLSARHTVCPAFFTKFFVCYLFLQQLHMLSTKLFVLLAGLCWFVMICLFLCLRV